MISLDPHRILIIKLRAIGDVVLATPVIENLRRRYPDRYIAFLTEEASADIVADNPFLHECIVLERKRWRTLPWRGRIREQADFLRTLRRKRFDLVIDLFGNPRSAILTLLSGAPHRVGFAFRGRRHCYTLQVPPAGGEVHEVDFNLDALRALGVPVVTTRPRIHIPAPAGQRARDWLARQEGQKERPLIGLNPGGGWAIKRWPPERFAVLADALMEACGVRILLFWGPGERPIVEAVVRSMRGTPLILPEVSLKELAAYLQCCALLISNDSGPMHMAAALGVPTVGIFGPTNPALQGPYGAGHRVVRQETVPCLGCNRLTCPIGNLCMTTLAPETVFQAVQPYLQQDA
jgi:predicted lipopolysaccharide heptosyltransferase III